MPVIVPELRGELLEQVITHFELAHPSSPRTFMAIRSAALAIPDLFPPAVPLFRINLRVNTEGRFTYAT